MRYRPDRPIALVGLMGAGKSTVGRRLARRLGLPFADADEEIERAAGMTVAEIFGRFGEEYFRDGERRVIARLVEGPPRVIATGGGAFMNPRTRGLLLERCVVVWLDAEPGILVERVSRRRHRPLLRDKDPRAAIEALATERNPVYAQAHLTVRSAPGSHERMAERIAQALAGHEGSEPGA